MVTVWCNPLPASHCSSCGTAQQPRPGGPHRHTGRWWIACSNSLGFALRSCAPSADRPGPRTHCGGVGKAQQCLEHKQKGRGDEGRPIILPSVCLICSFGLRFMSCVTSSASSGDFPSSLGSKNEAEGIFTSPCIPHHYNSVAVKTFEDLSKAEKQTHWLQLMFFWSMAVLLI